MCFYFSEHKGINRKMLGLRSLCLGTAYDTLSILFSSAVLPGFCGCALGQDRKVLAYVTAVLSTDYGESLLFDSRLAVSWSIS